MEPGLAAARAHSGFMAAAATGDRPTDEKELAAGVHASASLGRSRDRGDWRELGHGMGIERDEEATERASGE
ncbi:hypothetical protein KFK09_019635 [Dendrobium nobile]|uniref:Uncharacterized protein n=1 Tax=Dendrobium nobile TaxID=94219 RepID=A0A8T3AQR4_DENNO|nr:hypothetical protein KFK09_019635 [Dendrobium nobile]